MAFEKWSPYVVSGVANEWSKLVRNLIRCRVLGLSRYGVASIDPVQMCCS